MDAHAISSADRAWLRMDQPTNLMVITSVLCFDEPADWEAVREVLATRLVDRFPRFRQRIGRRPVQRVVFEDDPTFDLESHVHHVALPAPGGDAELQELVCDLARAPLDRTKPLWHAHLVDGYRGGSAMVMRMHHCIADGIALARVMLLLADDPVDAGIAPTPPDGDHGLARRIAGPVLDVAAGIRATGGALLHEAATTMLHPAHVADLAGEAAADARALAKVLTAPNEAPTVLKGDLGVGERVAWSRPVGLARVKDIGRTHGATVNDVLLSAMTGALRRHLEQHDDHVDELHVLVPFNLRPLDEPLDPRLGNRFGLVLLALPVGIADPVERLHEVSRRMTAIKRSREGVVSYGILGVMGRLPAEGERVLVDLFTAKGSAVMTNVPGPRRPVHVAGRRLRRVLVWAPCSGSVGMSVSIFSYCGSVTVGLMTDAVRVPDPARITRAFGAEVRALARPAPA